MKKYGVKLGFMSFFMRAATLALKEYPVVNSVIDGNEVVRRNYVDISVAVATPNGLMVPVLRNCQNYKFHELEIVSLDRYVRDWAIWRKKENKERLLSKRCKEELSRSLTVGPLAL